MSIIIGGDVVPCEKNVELFESGEVGKLLDNGLLDIWNEASYKFFNLECPITDSNNRIEKCGPGIKCPPNVINGMRVLSPTCIMLANNHILDYSERGLMDTTKILDKNNINWVGVGKNIDNLKKSFCFLCDDKRIAIYNCCEHEFSIATQNSYGANPYDEYSIERDLKDIKEKNDYLIVVYHGGKEHYRYPSPQLQKRCRRMVDIGADLVLCQHSHCIGCEEKYKNSRIVYGQGNFIFNLKRNEFWRTSLLVNIDVQNEFNISYIPIMQTKCGTRLASDKESREILGGFSERSEKIRNEGFVTGEYRKYAEKELGRYLVMTNRSLFLKAIRKYCPRLFNRINFDYAAILNVVECEAHNELFIEGLKGKIKGNKK